MDFRSLYQKISAIDEGAAIEECGGMMPMGAPGQSDSVNMNVSLNASGGGGIRELMNVLKNIDDVGAPQHGSKDHEDPLFGDSFEEEFGNSMVGHDGPTTAPVAAVLPTGDDLASKGIEAKKVNGGGNPLARKSPMEEGIVDQLQNLYTEIKTRQVDESAASRIADKVIGGMTKHGAVEALHPMIVGEVKKIATLNPVDRYSAYANIRGYFKDNPELSKMASELQGGYYEADILRGKYKTDAAKAKYAELEPMHQEFIKKVLGQ